MTWATNISTLFKLLLVTALLVGCGGGGGGDDGGDDEEPPPETTTFTVSGTLQAASGSAVDNDVNDPAAPRQDNNSSAAAQLIPNPVTLGGYANQAGTGPDGASRVFGDPRDWYRVALSANQTLTLFIAEDGRINDLDLSLFDNQANLVDASTGQGKFESITITQPGDYLILVEAFQGASNYTLTIGQPVAAAAQSLRLSDSFVPGQAIVGYHSDASDKTPQARAQALGMDLKGGYQGGNLLLDFKTMNQDSLRQALAVETPKSSYLFDSATHEKHRERLNTLLAVKLLNNRSDVKAASPNYIRTPSFTPNDEFFARQWHYPLLNLPQAWDVNTGSGAVVAVLDSGVVLAHPDLQGQLLPGFDFVSNLENAGDGDGIDADPSDPGGGAIGRNNTFHGTHVTGTVVAATNNAVGVAGVAFGAQVIPLRVIGTLGATDFDLNQAMRYAARLPNDSGNLPAQRADVINLSLGSPSFSATQQAVIDEIRQAGIAIVAAAGNAADSVPSFPASYDGVISVSAVDLDKTIAPYSSFGAFIDVAAPGGNTSRDLNGDGNPDGVLSTVATQVDGALSPDYTFFQGTSMASPHMAGVVALMRSANPSLTPQNIDDLLINGALTDELGTAGRDDNFGHGLINAYKAVVAAVNTAGGQITPVPILTVNPGGLNFGLSETTLNLTVTNGGGAELLVANPTDDAGGWLTIQPSVDANGLGTYTVTVDRSGLQDGIFTATITFSSNANTVQVPVIMQVANNLGAGGDVGQLYVVIFDPATQSTVTSTPAIRQEDDSYRFTFGEVEAGTYELFAGTDTNNDGFICDPGEACGAYLALDDPIDIQLERDRNDLDFAVGFPANLAGAQSVDAKASGIARQGRGVKRLEQ